VPRPLVLFRDPSPEAVIALVISEEVSTGFLGALLSASESPPEPEPSPSDSLKSVPGRGRAWRKEG
jgi:hypothetical protein